MDNSLDKGNHSTNKKTGHRWRLREKFLKGGLRGFLDYEIVELLLTLGTPRRDCKQQALDALQRFKVLRRVLEADEEELQEIKGIGPHNVFGIKLVQEVSRLFLKEKMMSLPVCHSSKRGLRLPLSFASRFHNREIQGPLSRRQKLDPRGKNPF